MGFLDFFRKKDAVGDAPAQKPPARQAAAQPPKTEPVPPETVEKIVEEFCRETSAPCIVLKPCYGQTVAPTGSKFGGQPFLPEGFTQPEGFDGKPMRLLAQLNFAGLPGLPGFPTGGLLQFYLACDDTFGAFYKEDENPQGHWRVVYHAEVDEAKGALSTAALAKEDMFPLYGEIPVAGELMQQPMNSSDYRFSDKFMEIYRRHLDTGAKSVWQLDESMLEPVYNRLCLMGHRIGGTPYFTQDDPRELLEKPYDTLLFQMDSDGPRDGTWEILWGDVGVANFFIQEEALQRLDFTDVMYTWDCC